MIIVYLEAVVDILSLVFLAGGIFFLFVGTVGLLRLPDLYNRLHATTKCDTLGAGLVLLSLALQSPFHVGVRLGLLIVFIVITNPTAAHVIARAAYNCGIKPVTVRRDSNG